MILVLEPDGEKIRDATDVIGEAFSQDAEIVAIPVERLSAEFFRLRTGVAGEIMQKFVNYRLKLAIVGDISNYVAASDPLRDLVYESNRGNQVWFVSNLDELNQRLNR